jgi:hypothetical protein
MERFNGKGLRMPNQAQTIGWPPPPMVDPPGSLTSLVSGKVLEGIRIKGQKGDRGGTMLFSATCPDPPRDQESPPVPLCGPVMPPRKTTTPVMPPMLTTRSDEASSTAHSLFEKPSILGSQSVPPRQPEIPGADPVDCSVMAPPSVASGAMILVQVFLHTPDQAEAARALAQEADAGTQRLGYHPLEVDLPRGSPVMVGLSIPKMEVDEPVQKVVWQGRTTSLQFGVSVPPGVEPGTVLGKVTLHLEGVPVGHIRFKLEVVAGSRTSLVPQRVDDQAQRYTQAFISYSSKDRIEVLKRVQMLERFHIHFFQDVLDLEPGMRWEQELYKHIDHCDLFLLFWSSAAKESPWVDKEVRYALARKQDDAEASPEIVPVLIEGPPVPMPPEHLAHLHFNDRLLYFMQDPKHPAS